MFTVILATTTSALFGVADFLGGFASRRAPAITVTAVSHSLGMVLFTLALLVFPARFSTVAITAGVVAGVAGGIGVAALYAALARGRMSVIAPLTAALSGSLPAVYDFLRGETIGPLAAVGLALALVATVIVSASTSPDESHAKVPLLAIGLALLAGIGFSGSFIAFSFAGDASGFWPLAAARVTSFGMLASTVLVRRGPLTLPRDARPSAFSAGLLDALANVTMLAAIRIGPLAVASVLGSLYPVVTVLLARVVLAERLHGWQRVGVGLALVAVVLTAVPAQAVG